MDSPNSLLGLIGFYTLLLYSFSQRHTCLTLGSWKRDIGAKYCLKLLLFHCDEGAKNLVTYKHIFKTSGCIRALGQRRVDRGKDDLDTSVRDQSLSTRRLVLLPLKKI